MAEKMPQIVETDEAGNVTATYVLSDTQSAGVCRVDVIHPTTKPLWQRTLDVFLPAGFPHSVTPDYIEYQIYDSLQAFASTIAGLLSSRAVLSSVGVGDADASPTYALLLNIAQESLGRAGTILFAARYGTALEPECKMYRLLADILNDFAFVLDCLSPALPKVFRVVALSLSSVLRALCGVAAGSAKASLSAHFAKWGNLGELNAKDSSQETVISLLGMWAGSIVVARVSSPMATWTTLVLLLAIHLETNRRAVKAVVMRTLNRQRATLVYHNLKRGRVPSLEDVSKQERIFERDSVLRGENDHILGYCSVGASLKSPLWSSGSRRMTSHSMQGDSAWLHRLLFSSKDQRYAIIPKIEDRDTPSSAIYLSIILRKDATGIDALRAWWQALVFAQLYHEKRLAHANDTDKHRDIVDMLEASATAARDLLGQYAKPLESAGWDLENCALETGSSKRIDFVQT